MIALIATFFGTVCMLLGSAAYLMTRPANEGMRTVRVEQGKAARRVPRSKKQ